MSQVIGLFGALWVGVALALALSMGILAPVMMISVTLNIRKIARQLERISNTAEATPGYVRTGPLNMR